MYFATIHLAEERIPWCNSLPARKTYADMVEVCAFVDSLGRLGVYHLDAVVEGVWGTRVM